MPLNLASLTQAIADASGRYSRLVLVVGTRGSGKTALLKTYAQATGSSYLPVGAVMAERLLATAPQFRDTEAGNILKDLCHGPGPFLLDNLELLFHPALQVDPYRLLVGLARTRTIVAAWPGSLGKGTLTYAFPGHKEYRSLVPSDAICISL